MRLGIQLSGLLLWTCVLSGEAAPPSGQPSPSTPMREAALAEVKNFMSEYATDLRAGNRVAIVARYHPAGTYALGNGAKVFESPAAIRKNYEEFWMPPRSFTWRDLSYEVIGDDAVMVLGLFDWEKADGGKMVFSYSALLLRHEGKWRIRVEDESVAPEKKR